MFPGRRSRSEAQEEWLHAPSSGALLHHRGHERRRNDPSAPGGRSRRQRLRWTEVWPISDLPRHPTPTGGLGANPPRDGIQGNAGGGAHCDRRLESADSGDAVAVRGRMLPTDGGDLVLG